MLKKAVQNKDNKYFILLSGECIPLFNYFETYKKITKSKKSRLNISLEAESYLNTGLYYADQWMILNRKCAKLLIKLKETELGKKFMSAIRQDICIKDDSGEDSCYCPDEIYPINWFKFNLGNSIYSKEFKKEINDIPTTYTFWDGKMPHPIRFNSKNLTRKFKKEICDSKALFARKFTNSTAKEMGLSC